MKRFLVLIFSIFFLTQIIPQENKYFLTLEKKDLATFNDGISLLRLLFNEADNNSKFVDNILWAVDKKLFQVSVPIKPDTINPVLTRIEFSYWICRIFNTNGGLVNTTYLTRYLSFKTCVATGIMPVGRGMFDSMTGKEILSIVGFLDNYVRINKIKPSDPKVLAFEEGYESLPKWRENLYKEFKEQRAEENVKLNKNKKTKPEKVKSIQQKFIDKDDLSITK